jgi:hypothetical protein
MRHANPLALAVVMIGEAEVAHGPALKLGDLHGTHRPYEPVPICCVLLVILLRLEPLE